MDQIWYHWHAHVEVLIGLCVVEVGYLLGVNLLRERYRLAPTVDHGQVVKFTLGVSVILIALLSPLHVISDKYLFSGHMLQHVLLTLVAPPLLITGIPDWLIRPLLKNRSVFLLSRLSTHPIIAFTLFNVIFSIWHVPELYDLSVNFKYVHIVEHLMFMGSAVMMWWPIFSTVPELPKLSYPLQIVYLFFLSIAQIVVFAPIAFSGYPIYKWYVAAPRFFHISALVDQQIGAIIMKVGGGVFFITLIIVAFIRWFNSDSSGEFDEGDEIMYSYTKR